jgi:hypothetical protein
MDGRCPVQEPHALSVRGLPLPLGEPESRNRVTFRASDHRCGAGGARSNEGGGLWRSSERAGASKTLPPHAHVVGRQAPRNDERPA